MKARLLQFILFSAKYLGGFKLAAWLTRKELRILCYHGISYADEHEFWPGVFMRAETFARRMHLVAKSGYPVLGLDEAVRGFEAGALPSCTTVITIDDGWLGTEEHMWPALQAHDLPATLYVASAYCEDRRAVANVVIQYIIWKAGPQAELKEVPKSFLDIDESWTLNNEAAQGQAAKRLIAWMSDQAGERQQALLDALAAELNIDLQALLRRGAFLYSTLDGLRTLDKAGLDLQLHTHHHRFAGLTDADAATELQENQRVLAEVCQDSPRLHFCYPSGGYALEQLPLLREAGVRSATTCQLEMNPPGTDPLLLNRFLDAENTSELKFEAELSGFAPLVRRMLKHLGISREKGQVST